MMLISIKLTLVAMISVPCVAVLCKKYGKYMEKIVEASQTALAAANAVSTASFANVPTVRAFAAEEAECELFETKLNGFREKQVKRAKAYTLYYSTCLILPQIVCVTVLLVGYELARSGTIRAGELLSFVFYLQALSDAFNTLGDVYANFATALGASRKVFELLAREPQGPTTSGGKDCADVRGDLALEGVVFSYPSRPTVTALSGLTL